MQLEAGAIGDHAIVGDCRSAALVARDGSIEWLCWPRFDSPSLFASILDPSRGGSWRLAPEGDARTRWRYEPGTNVLLTTHETANGVVEVADLMTLATGAAGSAELAPEHEILRKVRCLSGEVDVGTTIDPRPGYASATGQRRRKGYGWQVSAGRDVMIVRSDIELRDEEGVLCGRRRMRAGEVAWSSLAYARGSPAVIPPLGSAAAVRFERTARWWSEWSARARYEGPYRDAVVRSALVLRLMLYTPSGAVVAAPTTSLPEWPGTSQNWDYRYCWLRDAALTVRALEGLGYRAEAYAFCSWLLHATRLSHPALRPLYAVFGDTPGRERELAELSGHASSRPVRVGNAADTQRQLDVYGELVEAVTYTLRDAVALDRQTRRMLRRLGDQVCRTWRTKDAGIWEERGEGHEHTLSRALCAVALARLLDLDRRGLIGLRSRERWESILGEIRDDVRRNGWNEGVQAYTERYGAHEMDASLLLLGWYGFEDVASSRFRLTVKRIRERLGHGALLRRRESWTEEGAFLACSFWLIEALDRAGERDEARRLFEELLGYANDLGLYAEEADPKTGNALGNFPQALTHLGLVNAALTLGEERAGA